jgi:DNA-binding NarL/FixJ family response regulator
MGASVESEDACVGLDSPTRRVVLVADNSLIVEALRAGLRHSGQFNLVGYADTLRTSAAAIVRVHPDAVLLDDADRSGRPIELVRELKAAEADLVVIILTLEMSPDWLERAFEAGAAGAISKATHPTALATLLRAMLDGHIFHRFAPEHSAATPGGDEVADDTLSLTSRELEILQLVSAGATNGDVARELWVTEQTVKFHLRNVYRKLDVANRTEASHYAHVNGLVKPARSLTAVS